ncbi:phosphate signaling complex protein PhoU [Desulfovibrio sulfodismutans]|uniref:Phosphate-specific transport system accessory protein PhoU n=1 Tax=Desulfolutivibrio sulfodismutans TaxID=63561 RepID=A0A7K3NT29_9BACT|nr:phosphate signaling complex protein PhoU [Desulfolutivibrio sulfodismutans]NDY58409.1 phosphate signaling complex protein PhoU [Desulfolutivibrio sulfodismutans]QLA13977.1 phosphate signaling complex protein PhoU [Desulfolutivibrio sulfodismutans DSM 3696]
METALQQELTTLRVNILKMLHMASEAVHKATQAVFDNNADLARQVIDDDRHINALECLIDSESLRILALHQPVAKDLRFIVGCMRMIVNIERLGDEGANIAERVLILHERQRMEINPALRQLSEMALDLVRKTITSFMELDAELAKEIFDRNIDAMNLNVRIFKDTTDYMIRESRTVERAVQYSFIAHSLKRICDQSANIAESIIFIKEGENYKHKCGK